MRHCAKCEIFDKEMKRCRPYTGAAEGCGCAVFFLALSTDTCWLDEQGGNGWRAVRK